jgi:tetratricopeptide (TPR) repeat protein
MGEIDFFSSPEVNKIVENGIAKANSKNFDGALQDFNKALEIDPYCASAFLERSKVKQELGDEKGANQDLISAKLMIDKSDEGLKAYEEAGLNYDSGDYINAIKNYNKAISFLPSLTDVYYNRGIAKEMLKDFTGTIEDFSKGIELNASNKVDAYHRRGYIRFYKLKDEAGALLDYNKAIELDPSNGDFYYHRAKILDSYHALQDLTKAEQFGRSDANLYFDIYLRKLEMHDYTGCIKALDKYIELKPTNPKISISQIYYFRGFVKSVLNDTNSAQSDFDKAIELDNKNAEAYYFRGLSKNALRNDNSGDADIIKAKNLGYHVEEDAYNEEGAKAEAEEALKRMIVGVEANKKLHGAKLKEELDKEYEALSKDLFEIMKKSKE